MNDRQRARTQRTLVGLLLASLLLLARAEVSTKQIAFASPTNGTQVIPLSSSITSAKWLCLNNSPSTGSGMLVSVISLQELFPSDPEGYNEAAAKLAPAAVFLFSSRNFVDGNLPPVVNTTRHPDTVFTIVKDWVPRGVIARNVAAQKIPGSVAYILNERAGCRQFDRPFTEIARDAGTILEAQALANMDIIKSILNGTVSIDLINQLNPFDNVDPIVSAVNNISSITFVSLNSSEPNQWDLVRAGGFMIGWRVVFTLVAGATTSIAGAKLISYIRFQGWEISVPKMILGLQFLIGLFRTPYAAVDPLLFLYAETPGWVGYMMLTIHFPINIIGTLLLGMYWREVLDGYKIGGAVFLRRMKIPFIVVSLLVVILEVINSSLRAALLPVAVAVYLTNAVYIIVIAVMNAFFLTMAYRILKRLIDTGKHTNIKLSGRRRTALRSTITFVILTGSMDVVFVVGLIQAAVDSWFYSPVGFATSLTFVYFGIYVGALVQILSLSWAQDPQKHASSSHSRQLQGGTKSSVSHMTGTPSGEA